MQIDQEEMQVEDEEDLFGDGNLDQDLFDDKEFEFSNQGGQNQDDDFFDYIVGQLQEIVLEEKFESLQKTFFDHSCMEFDDEEENKPEYMIIFKKYQKNIESYINQVIQLVKCEELKNRVEGFEMNQFLKLLSTRQDQIDFQLLEMLLSFSDYLQFKEIMLEHKKNLLQMTIRKQQQKGVNKKPKENNIFQQEQSEIQKMFAQDIKKQQKPKKDENKKQNIDDSIMGFQIHCTPLVSKKQF